MPGNHHDEKKFRKNPAQEAKEIHGPYWMRAHRDWRFIVVVFLMLAAMLTYLLTSDLSWFPHSHHVALPVLGVTGN
jgi:hypothetical protein